MKKRKLYVAQDGPGPPYTAEERAWLDANGKRIDETVIYGPHGHEGFTDDYARRLADQNARDER